MKNNLNATIYHKLLLQAEEAKELNMTKLASGILGSLGPMPEEELVSYNFNELQEDIYQGLWKLAANVIKYHDLQSVDAGKVHETLESLAIKLITEVEKSLNVDNSRVGPLEDKVFGQL